MLNKNKQRPNLANKFGSREVFASFAAAPPIVAARY
jgi:hypothetical protein